MSYKEAHKIGIRTNWRGSETALGVTDEMRIIRGKNTTKIYTHISKATQNNNNTGRSVLQQQQQQHVIKGKINLFVSTSLPVTCLPVCLSHWKLRPCLSVSSCQRPCLTSSHYYIALPTTTLICSSLSVCMFA